MAKDSLLFISNKGETLPVVWKLRQEGIPAEIYIHDLNCRQAYAGLMPRLGLGDLMDAVKRAERVVIDIIFKNNKAPRDLALFDKFGISHEVPGLFGVLGDKLQKPPYIKEVIGGGALPEKVELDREEGVKLARACGFAIPEYQEFTSLKAGAKFLYGPGKDKLWVFKPSGNLDLDLTKVEGFPGELQDLLTTTYPQRLGNAVKFILQEKVEGVEVSSELWCWYGKILHPNRTLEDKKLGDGDTGPAVGSQSNTVWACKDAKGIVHAQMQKIPWLKSYCGPIDANCIITKDGQAWFLEWTFRFGYSALYLFLYLIKKGKLGNFFLKDFRADLQQGFVASQVLTLSPFPYVRDKPEYVQRVKDNLINNPIDTEGTRWIDVYQDSKGKLRCAGGDGLLGVMMGQGEDAEAAIRETHKRISTIKKNGISGDLQFRTEHDHLESHLGRLEQLEKWDINVF